MKTGKIPLDDPFFLEFPSFKKRVGDIKPRTSEDTCLLCLNNKADKVRSHIFPDFITKTIFKDPKRRRLIQTDGLGLRRYRSTAPKEAYLMCNSCENRLGALERLISNYLPVVIEKLRDSATEIRGAKGDVFITLIGIEPGLIHLFVFSLLWRAHVCQQQEFVLLVLSPEHEEALRLMLDTCLRTKRDEMLRIFYEKYSGRLPLNYDTMIAYEKPLAQAHAIRGAGWKYNSSYGYRLNVNEISYMFIPVEDATHAAGSRTKDVLVVSAAQWNSLAASNMEDARRINQLSQQINNK